MYKTTWQNFMLIGLIFFKLKRCKDTNRIVYSKLHFAATALNCVQIT
jgi:hypothetical protein